jgi:hypothetical protein
MWGRGYALGTADAVKAMSREAAKVRDEIEATDDDAEAVVDDDGA